jgi:penicillin-binding protein 1C
MIFAMTGCAAVAVTLACAGWVYSLGHVLLGRNLEYSHAVLDRDGRLLRAYATNEGRWRLPVAEQDVDPRFLKLLFAYEDKRFRDHLGVDPLSLGRAAVQFVSRGHIVSGGSTITMQVARLLEPRERRSLSAKLRQIVRALALERALGKRETLALYLTLAPYGGNLEGVRAAALAYFGKEPRKLSLAEAALLVALPQSPELRRPDRFPDAARAARDRVLDRAAMAGLIPRDEIARAQSQPAPRERKPLLRTPPIRLSCSSLTSASIASRSTFFCKRACRRLLTSVHRRSALTSRLPFSQSTMQAAR